MKFGNLDSPVTIDNTQKVIYDSGELGSAVTSVTISGLNGDVDEEYELIIRAIDNDGSDYYILNFNGDTAGNYGWQELAGVNATASAARVTEQNSIRVASAGTNGDVAFSTTKIKAKSGYIRTMLNKWAAAIAGTTVTNVKLIGGVWNNTVDNITSMTITGSASGIGIGSRVILLKKVTATDGVKTGDLEVQGKIYGVWEEVYNSTLTEAATSVTISGLTGNTDVLYRLRSRVVNGYNGNVGYYFRVNNDSGASIYGYQSLDGQNTTVSAARGTGSGFIPYANCGALNQISMSNLLLYAKSGYVRTAINELTWNIATTTINAINLVGNSYNETATEITRMDIVADQTNGLGIGSSFVIEKLNL